jgi:hypothetical protein
MRRIQVTDKDIPVYVYCVTTPTEGAFQAILEPHIYRVGKLYTSSILASQTAPNGLTGLSSYVYHPILTEDINNEIIRQLVPADRSIVKLDCTIPAGSRYSIDETGECVSDKLYVNKSEKVCVGVQR